jgi:hypothetical protein
LAASFALAVSLAAGRVCANDDSAPAGVAADSASGTIVVNQATNTLQSTFYAPHCGDGAIADTCRSYKRLQDDQQRSFPDLVFFLYHHSDLRFPSYLPTCSTGGIDSPSQLVGRLQSATNGDNSELLNAVTVAARDLQNLVFRLRGCDYAVSVYAWNTRLRPHDAPFDFTWQVGCNSFAYESSADWLSRQDSTYRSLIAKLFEESAGSMAGPSAGTHATTALQTEVSQTFRSFITEDYLKYADLFERLSSCSDSVAALTYPPNTKRILCNDAAFFGALAAGSAAAFGRRWTSGLQNSVTAAGTVIIAYPALCGSASSGGGPSAGKISTSSGASSTSGGASASGASGASAASSSRPN